MRKFSFIILIAFFCFGTAFGQSTTPVKQVQTTNVEAEQLVTWYTFQEAMEMQKKTNKTMFVDVFTYWCGPCRMLDKQTFNHPVIAEYLNNNFIPVKFNAESNEPISFHNKTFINPNPNANPTERRRKSTHHFTNYVADNNGRIAYPTMVFVDAETAIYEPLVGFLRPEQLEPILKYMSDEKLQKMNYNDFVKGFQSKIQ